MTTAVKTQIKVANEELIKKAGYHVNDWLPILDTNTLRDVSEIKGRMAAMNALINIAFGAPTSVIDSWLKNNNLENYLSSSEKAVLMKGTDDLTELDVNSLEWYLESLWSFMWLTEMIDDLSPEEYVGDNMASLLPNLKEGENNNKLEFLATVRPIDTAYQMLDYYYRLHWYCVDERLKGKEVKLNEGVVYHRRKSLEWAFDETADWDQVEMGT